MTSSETSDSEDEDLAVQSLVAGREKRQTAGNRLSSLLQRQEDDDLELLFAEDDAEEDAEFNDDHDIHSDVDMGSSSEDEEDPTSGAAGTGEDLAGEQSLQQEERAAKKRERQRREAAFRPRLPKPKVKPTASASGAINPTESRVTEDHGTAASPTTTRPGKNQATLIRSMDGQLRTSSRRHTVEFKKAVRLRLEETEVRRKQQLHILEAANRRRQELLDRARSRTQADRLAEAERVEQQNLKSRNRWEEAETRRLEEQKAKLMALQNRQLHGPVISRWSGPAVWLEGKLTAVGASAVARAAQKYSADADTNTASLASADASPQRQADRSSARVVESTTNVSDDVAMSLDEGTIKPTETPLATLETHAASDKQQNVEESLTKASDAEVAPETSIVSVTSATIPSKASPLAQLETAAVNRIMLHGLESGPALPQCLQPSRRGAQRLSKPTHKLCALTGLPARFRDPATSLAYANMEGYKAIRTLQQGQLRWSDLLGCYVGRSDVAAAGVPSGFLTSH